MARHISFCTLLACFLFSGRLPAQTWQWQNPSPQGNTLYAVTFAGDNHGWAVGQNGTILHTADGGVTWTIQASGEGNLADVAFVDSLCGWAAGDNRIFHTTNGGALWLPQSLADTATVRSMTMIDSANGWLVGGAQCYHTTDGGRNWQAELLPMNNNLRQVVFSDERHGWILGDTAIVARTTDGGAEWTADTLSTSSWCRLLASMDFVDSLCGWIAGYVAPYQQGTFRTTDGGAHWTAVPASLSDAYRHIDFLDSNRGWAVGGWGGDFWSSVMQTSDGGNTWTRLNGTNIGLAGLHVSPEARITVVGDIGLIWRRDTPDESWQRASRHVTLAHLNDVAFADDQHGVAVGTRSPYSTWWEPYVALLHTTDGGAEWTRTDSLPNASASAIDLCASGDGWAVGCDASGDHGRLWHTSDFGASWQEQTPPCSDALRDVEFVDDLHGFLTCGNEYPRHGTLLQTLDGGLTWTALFEDTTHSFCDVFALDAQTLWLTGDSGMVRFSDDGGLHWQSRDALAIAVPVLQQLTICFADTLRGWLTDPRYDAFPSLSTTDGGRSWQEWDFHFTDMDFADGQYGLAVGPDGALRTRDGGQSWEVEAVPTSPACFSAVDLVTPTSGWVVGDYGTILRYTGTLSPVADPPILHPSAFALSAVPNPFNPQTRLSFDLPAASRVTLNIYDLTGRLVTTLADKLFPAGTHALTFNGQDLPSGLYFARIQSATHTQTHKLVLLK